MQSTQEFVFRPPSERALAAEAFASKLPRPSKALMSAAVLRAWAARLPERVTLRVLTRLTLDGDGARVQSHQEEWLNRKLSKWPAGPHAVKRAIGRLVAKGTPMPD